MKDTFGILEELDNQSNLHAQTSSDLNCKRSFDSNEPENARRAWNAEQAAHTYLSTSENGETVSIELLQDMITDTLHLAQSIKENPAELIVLSIRRFLEELS